MAPIPYIHLLCMEDHFIPAFNAALEKYDFSSSIAFEIHNMALQFLPASKKFDLVVSPANSYGRLDGAFDDAISRAFSPRDDYFALTLVAQQTLYNEWRGFAPPGTCTLVRIPDEYAARSRNVWDAKYMALCPTMRTPQNVTWDHEVVYEVVWSLLCALHKHNQSVADGHMKIESMLITPLATGIGRVSAHRWAEQFVLAMKHFLEATNNPGEWSALEWTDIEEICDAVADTHNM